MPRVHPETMGSLPARVELDAVPFHPQRDYECGPAALAMVLGHAGRPVSVDALVAQVYLPSRKGSLQPEMAAALRGQGLVPCRLAPRREVLMHELADGQPILLMLNLGLAWRPTWHYAVAIGYDLERGTMLLRSGTTRRLEMTARSLERHWMRAQGWALVAAAPTRIPVTASLEQWLSASAALERTAPADARSAAQAAVDRWPGDARAWLALGNASWALQQMPAAESAFRHATLINPSAADAWNNLAVSLAAQGRRQEALDASDAAIRLGGPRRARYEQTRAELHGTGCCHEAHRRGCGPDIPGAHCQTHARSPACAADR